MAVKNTTLVGTVAGAPLAPHALPNTVATTSKALWVQAGGHVCKATVRAFIAAQGGKHNVILVKFTGFNNPASMRGLTPAVMAHLAGTGPATTRGNCLIALSNGATLTKAHSLAQHAPNTKTGKTALGKPCIVSAWQAMLQGTYGPNKYGGPGQAMLVGLKG
jgi:hypothetical protein